MTGEADVPDVAENHIGAAEGSEHASADRLTRVERTLERIVHALGMADVKDGEVPDLRRAVTDLRKRVDGLQGILDTDSPP